MKKMFYLALMIMSFSTLADNGNLDLSLPKSFYAQGINAEGTWFNSGEAFTIARSPLEGAFKKKRIKPKEADASDQMMVSPKNDKSVLPSILACSLLGMSLYGNNSDSGAWRAGSAALCGVSLAWYND